MMLFLFAFLAFLAGLRSPKGSHFFALLGSGGALAAAVAGLVFTLREGVVHQALGGWPRPIGIEYTLDPLAGFMTVIVTFFGFLITVSGWRPAAELYTRRSGPYYTLVLLLLAGLTGMVLTGDLFNLFVFLEIASLCAYSLIASGGDRGVFAGFRYLVLGTAASYLYLLGVGFLFFETGTLNMVHMRELLPEVAGLPSVMVGIALIVTGLAMKAAFFPLYLWLPDAYADAPAPVGALLASMMTKVMAYAMIRILFWVFDADMIREEAPVALWILLLGSAGILFPAVQAAAQQQFRRMLAYSSVSQLGFIAVGIGLATPLGILAALLHMMNHAVMKSCLFLSAGAIRFRTGDESIRGMAALSRTMPWTSASLGVAALSLVGVPPTGGFFSKWYLVLAAVERGQWLALAAILIGTLLTAGYVFRVLQYVYLTPVSGSPASGSAEAGTPAQTREAPLSMLGPIVFLASAAVWLGLFNYYIITWVLDASLPPF